MKYHYHVAKKETLYEIKKHNHSFVSQLVPGVPGSGQRFYCAAAAAQSGTLLYGSGALFGERQAMDSLQIRRAEQSGLSSGDVRGRPRSAALWEKHQGLADVGGLLRF